MKLLIITNLFPNAREPNRSTFNFQQFTALSKLCELKVVAPIPLFQYSVTQVPLMEKIGGIDVFHPRYLVIPKILRCTYGLAFFAGIWQTLKTIEASFKYDAILAAWAYPDAFGAAIAAKLLKKKLYVKVQGSDINLAHQYWLRPAMIKWALAQAEKVIAVSHPLKQKMIRMGIPEEKISVIQNGVDTARFYPRDKVVSRQALGLDAVKRYIVYIGNLAEVKGVEYLIRAFAKLSSPIDLVIVGDGPLSKGLKALARELGVQDRVHFKGRRPYDEIPVWLNAADVFCLPSLNEGCPNVVLEAQACGVKVVASNVGGVPDIIDSRDKGWLARAKDPEDLAKCLKLALEAPALSQSVRIMSWEENAKMLLDAMV